MNGLVDCSVCKEKIAYYSHTCPRCGADRRNPISKLLWVICIIGCCIGAYIAACGVYYANGAPQEAASAAVGIACAVIPYCLARASE